jgi:hypothetical protein
MAQHVNVAIIRRNPKICRVRRIPLIVHAFDGVRISTRTESHRPLIRLVTCIAFDANLTHWPLHRIMPRAHARDPARFVEDAPRCTLRRATRQSLSDTSRSIDLSPPPLRHKPRHTACAAHKCQKSNPLPTTQGICCCLAFHVVILSGALFAQRSLPAASGDLAPTLEGLRFFPSQGQLKRGNVYRESFSGCPMLVF